MIHTPVPAHSLRALREWMRENGLNAIVVQADTAEVQPVAPIVLCRHCTLPVGAGGPHACEQFVRERNGTA